MWKKLAHDIIDLLLTCFDWFWFNDLLKSEISFILFLLPIEKMALIFEKVFAAIMCFCYFEGKFGYTIIPYL